MVLPDPFGPSMPSTEPFGTSRSMPSTATVEPNTLRSPIARAAKAGPDVRSAGASATSVSRASICGAVV